MREAEGLARQLGADQKTAATRPAAAKSRDVLRVEEELSDLLTAAVEVRLGKRVKRHGQVEQTGELAIRFGSLEELDGLIERLRALARLSRASTAVAWPIWGNIHLTRSWLFSSPFTEFP